MSEGGGERGGGGVRGGTSQVMPFCPLVLKYNSFNMRMC